jgi:hypothetical protein
MARIFQPTIGPGGRCKALTESSLALYSHSGIEKIYEKESFIKRGYNKASFVVGAKPGYSFLEYAYDGEICVESYYKGNHGYFPDRGFMDAIFMMKGAGVDRGKDIGNIELTDVASILAEMMGLVMPLAMPQKVKKEYLLYDDKPCIYEDGGDCAQCLNRRITGINKDIGYNEYGDSHHFLQSIS